MNLKQLDKLSNNSVLMDKKSIEQYCTRCLDMLDSLNNSGSSYSNSYSVELDEENNRILYILNFPSSILPDDNLYQTIYKVWNIALFPKFTLLRQTSPIIIERLEKDFSQARAFSFPYLKGIPKRLEIFEWPEFERSLSNQEIPIMESLTIDYDKISLLAVAGTTGAGKSVALSYLIKIISRFSDMVIIDPKYDSPSRLASELGIKCLSPVRNSSNAEFLSMVNEELAKAVDIIYKRQDTLFNNPETKFKPYVLVIDELVALKQSTEAKKVKDSFDSLINIITLMGRATSVRMILSAQSFNANESISTSARSQISCAIQLGKLTKGNLQYLFPDINGSEGIVVPNGPGCGIIQINDGVHPPNILPVMMPSIKTE